ncbi:unnamed protein product [marine sediment metagenome]|uniref:PARP-type domain-containing protein n=1 Tax=marine sediment metagenome TaxID=412755 RepID=X1T3W0_9ZZZZ
MEYQGGRPGCYKCKQPITSIDDYYTLIWKGKTWSMEVNYHIDCLTKAFEDGEITFKEADPNERQT